MREPIRILHVLGRLDRGGAETMIMNLYRSIDRKKVQFDFIIHTNDECAYNSEISDLGGIIYNITRYTGKNHLQYKKAWHIFFEDHPEYKIIHGHVRSTASIYLGIARNHGLVTIAHSHNTSSGKGISAVAKNILQFPIRYTADHMFSCSEKAGEWLFGKKACNASKFHILKNAIDPSQFIFDDEIRIRKRKELSIEDKFVIGHIGRFHNQKNHDFLIDIFNEIHQLENKAVLLLIGDGETFDEIKNKVWDLGLTEYVMFVGARSDISQLFQSMDIFVFPSLFEGLPLTLIEAQASGLPCIISDSISKEVQITNLISTLSLNLSAKKWAENILNAKIDAREDTFLEISNANYNCLETSKWLEDFYLTKI